MSGKQSDEPWDIALEDGIVLFDCVVLIEGNRDHRKGHVEPGLTYATKWQRDYYGGYVAWSHGLHSPESEWWEEDAGGERRGDFIARVKAEYRHLMEYGVRTPEQLADLLALDRVDITERRETA